MNTDSKHPLFVFSGMSGVGKSTLLKMIMLHFPCFGFSVSATTRAPRGKEIDGVDYHFTDPVSMLSRVGAGEFFEAQIVHGNLYGTPVDSVRQLIEKGLYPVLDIDVMGFMQLNESPLIETEFDVCSIFILPPDKASLLARLNDRGDDQSVIERRMARYDLELQLCEKLYEYCVVNHDGFTGLEKCFGDICQIIRTRFPELDR